MDRPTMFLKDSANMSRRDWTSLCCGRSQSLQPGQSKSSWLAARSRRTTSVRADAWALALALVVAASVAIGGCTKAPQAPKSPPRIYASAEEVGLDLRRHTFVFGHANQIA